MQFNYWLEKKRFDEEWNRLEKEYAEEGMESAAICAMRAHDWDQFRAQRIYALHTVPLDSLTDHWEAGASDKSSLAIKYPGLIAKTEEPFSSGVYEWIDAIENEALHNLLRTFPQKDILLLFYLTAGHTQTEVAGIMGISQVAISKRLRRIKEKIKKVLA